MGEWVRLPDELYHHGIKGMKWGVLRTTEQLGYRKDQKKKLRAAKSRAYKDAQSKKQRSFYEKIVNKDKKKAAKYAARSSKYKEKGNDQKAKKYSDKAQRKIAQSKAAQKLMEKELAAIKNLKSVDIRREKIDRAIYNLSSGVWRATPLNVFGTRIDLDEFTKYHTAGKKKKS